MNDFQTDPPEKKGTKGHVTVVSCSQAIPRDRNRIKTKTKVKEKNNQNETKNTWRKREEKKKDLFHITTVPTAISIRNQSAFATT